MLAIDTEGCTVDNPELDEPRRVKSLLDNPFVKIGIVVLAVWIVISGTLNVLEVILPRWVLYDLDDSINFPFGWVLTFEGLCVAAGVFKLLEASR